MIQIHIERLIVDDMTLSPHQQQQFKAAVEAELIRLLTADGLALQARDHAVSSVPCRDDHPRRGARSKPSGTAYYPGRVHRNKPVSHQHANQAHSRMTRAQSETSDVVVHDHDQEPSTSVHHEVAAHEDTAGDTRVPRATRFTRDFSQIQVSRTTQTMVQAKTTVSQPGDRYEREADRVAETVVKMPTPSASVTEQIDLTGPRISAARPNHVHRQSEATEDLLQAKASPGRPPDVTPQIQHDIRASQGSGQPLPHAVRDFFEPRFGQDFSQVRVHTDARSAASAQQLNAQAFTQGQNIFFAPGRYQPNTQGGQQLLAHELTHTVQQSGGESGVIARRVNTSETGANEAPQTE